MNFVPKQVFLILMAILPLVSLCQKNKRNKDAIIYKYTLSFEGGGHKIGYPFRELKEEIPFYPAIIIGAEDDWHSKKFGQLFQAIEMGVFHNNSAVSGYFLSLGVGLRFQAFFGTYLEGKVGVGFMHVFVPRPVYSTNPSGKFERVKDLGEIRPSGDGCVSFGQTFMRNKWDKPISLFVRYRSMGQLFFNDRARILPHTFGTVGLKIHIKE